MKRSLLPNEYWWYSLNSYIVELFCVVTKSFSCLNKLLKCVYINQKSLVSHGGLLFRFPFKTKQNPVKGSTVWTQPPGVQVLSSCASTLSQGLTFPGQCSANEYGSVTRGSYFEGSIGSSKISLFSGAPMRLAEIFSELHSCVGFIISNHMNFLLPQEPDLHHILKAFLRCSCPLCFFVSLVFFPNTFCLFVLHF